MAEQSANTSPLAPPGRRRHREDHVQEAYTTQRNGAIKGLLLCGFLGAGSCLLAHNMFPAFRQHTLALKGFLTTGCAIFGFCIGAENVLQDFESQQRSGENLIRDKARAELGRKGLVATEIEIEKWRVGEREKLLQRYRDKQLSQETSPEQDVD